MKERYPEDWPALPSVTEILSAFPGPELIAWFRKMAFSEQRFIQDKAKDIGTTLHQLRIKIEHGEPFEIVTKYPEEIQNCIKSYLSWKKERQIPKILYSEVKMYSMSLGIRGTLDDIAGNEKKLILLEHKTSKGIYDDAREQAVIYKKLFESPDTVFEMPCEFYLREISSVFITRFPKDKPEFESVQVLPSEEEELFESFMHKLAIYNIRKRRAKEKNNV